MKVVKNKAKINSQRKAIEKELDKKSKPKSKKVAITSGKTTTGEVSVDIADNRELQDGIQPTNVKLKDKPPQGYVTIGNAVGVTLNMGDYQSARIDVFIQRNVPDNNTSIKEGFEEINELLMDEVQRQSSLLDEE